MKFRRLWSAFFHDWDVVLSPVITTAALPHMQEGPSIMSAGLPISAHHIQTGPVWERQITVNGRTVAYNDMLFWPGLTAGYPFARDRRADGLHASPDCLWACRSPDRFTATG